MNMVMIMLEITKDNCHKCDLETLIDPNKSQNFWINRRDLEIESKCNWPVIFDKCEDSLRQNIEKNKHQTLHFNLKLEKIIKNCKTTNLKFLKIKEKLGLCLYVVFCDEQGLISMSEEVFKEEKMMLKISN